MGCGSSISDDEALALQKRTGGKISADHIREWYFLLLLFDAVKVQTLEQSCSSRRNV
jgi:hypothetical protein